MWLNFEASNEKDDQSRMKKDYYKLKITQPNNSTSSNILPDNSMINSFVPLDNLNILMKLLMKSWKYIVTLNIGLMLLVINEALREDSSKDDIVVESRVAWIVIKFWKTQLEPCLKSGYISSRVSRKINLS